MSRPGRFRGKGFGGRGNRRNGSPRPDSPGGFGVNSRNDGFPSGPRFNAHNRGPGPGPCPNFNASRGPRTMLPRPPDNWNPRGGVPPLFPIWRGRPPRYNNDQPPRPYMSRMGQGPYAPRFPFVPNRNYQSPPPQRLPTPEPPPKPTIPHPGSEEERKQKITEAADALKRKLSSVAKEPDEFWRDDDYDLLPDVPHDDDNNSRITNKGIPELKHDPPELNLTLGDLRDIGRVDHDHKNEQTIASSSTNEANFAFDESEVKILDEIPVRQAIEIDLWSDENHGEQVDDDTIVIESQDKSRATENVEVESSAIQGHDSGSPNSGEESQSMDQRAEATESENPSTKTSIERPNETQVDCYINELDTVDKTDTQNVNSTSINPEAINTADNNIPEESGELQLILQDQQSSTSKISIEIDAKDPNDDATQLNDDADEANVKETMEESQAFDSVQSNETEREKQIIEETNKLWPALTSSVHYHNDSTMIPGLDGFCTDETFDDTNVQTKMQNDNSTDHSKIDNPVAHSIIDEKISKNNFIDSSSGSETAIVDKKIEYTPKKLTIANLDKTNVKPDDDRKTTNDKSPKKTKNNSSRSLEANHIDEKKNSTRMSETPSSFTNESCDTFVPVSSMIFDPTKLPPNLINDNKIAKKSVEIPPSFDPRLRMRDRDFRTVSGRTYPPIERNPDFFNPSNYHENLAATSNFPGINYGQSSMMGQNCHETMVNHSPPICRTVPYPMTSIPLPFPVLPTDSTSVPTALPIEPAPALPIVDKEDPDMDDGLGDMQEAMEFAEQIMTTFPNLPTFESSNVVIDDIPTPPPPSIKNKVIDSNSTNSIENSVNVNRRDVDDRVEVALTGDQLRSKITFNLTPVTKMIKMVDWSIKQERDESADVASAAIAEFGRKWSNDRSTLNPVDDPRTTDVHEEREKLRTTETSNGIHAEIGKRDDSQGHNRTRTKHPKCSTNDSTNKVSGSRKIPEDITESSWKNRVIGRFLKMSKNDICNMVNNTSLRKFNIPMTHLVKEQRSTLSLGMRNNEEEKLKDTDAAYNRKEFMDQLSAMLDPSATVDVCNLPTQFLHHLSEVLQLDSTLENDAVFTPSTNVSTSTGKIPKSAIAPSIVTKSLTSSIVSKPAIAPSIVEKSVTPSIVTEPAIPPFVAAKSVTSSIAPKLPIPSSIVPQSAIPSIVSRSVTPSIVTKSATPSIVAKSAPPPIVVKSATPPIVAKSAPPPIVVKSATPPIVVKSATPPIVVKSVTPSIVTKSAPPPIVQKSATLPIVQKSATPSIVQKSATPLIVTKSATPPIVPRSAPPPIVTKSATALIVQKSITSPIVSKSATPSISQRPATSTNSSRPSSTPNFHRQVPIQNPQNPSTSQTSSPRPATSASLSPHRSTSSTPPTHPAQPHPRPPKECANAKTPIDHAKTSKRGKIETSVTSLHSTNPPTIPLQTLTKPRRRKRRISESSDDSITPKCSNKNNTIINNDHETTELTATTDLPRHHHHHHHHHHQSTMEDRRAESSWTMGNPSTTQESSNSLNMADVDDIFTAGIARVKKKLVNDPKMVKNSTTNDSTENSSTWTISKKTIADTHTLAKDLNAARLERATVELDKIFTAGIARAKLASIEAVAIEVKDQCDKDVVHATPGLADSSKTSHPTFQSHRDASHASRCRAHARHTTKCEKWNRRRAREDLDAFRNLTREEWEAKYGATSDSTYEKEYRALVAMTERGDVFRSPTKFTMSHDFMTGNETDDSHPENPGKIVKASSGLVETWTIDDDNTIIDAVVSRRVSADVTTSTGSTSSSLTSSITSESSTRTDPGPSAIEKSSEVATKRRRARKTRTLSEGRKNPMDNARERKRRHEHGVSRREHKSRTKRCSRHRQRTKDRRGRVKVRRKREKKRKKRKTRRSEAGEENSASCSSEKEDYTDEDEPLSRRRRHRHRRTTRMLTEAEIKKELDEVVVVKEEKDEPVRQDAISKIAIRTGDDSRPPLTGSGRSSCGLTTKTKAQLKQLPALMNTVEPVAEITTEAMTMSSSNHRKVVPEVLADKTSTTSNSEESMMTSNDPTSSRSSERNHSSVVDDNNESSSSNQTTPKKLHINAYKERARLRLQRENEKLRFIHDNPTMLTQNLLNIPLMRKKVDEDGGEKVVKQVETSSKGSRLLTSSESISTVVEDSVTFAGADKMADKVEADRVAKINSATVDAAKISATAATAAKASVISANASTVVATTVESQINKTTTKKSPTMNATIVKSPLIRDISAKTSVIGDDTSAEKFGISTTNDESSIINEIAAEALTVNTTNDKTSMMDTKNSESSMISTEIAENSTISTKTVAEPSTLITQIAGTSTINAITPSASNMNETTVQTPMITKNAETSKISTTKTETSTIPNPTDNILSRSTTTIAVTLENGTTSTMTPTISASTVPTSIATTIPIDEAAKLSTLDTNTNEQSSEKIITKKQTIHSKTVKKSTDSSSTIAEARVEAGKFAHIKSECSKELKLREKPKRGRPRTVGVGLETTIPSTIPGRTKKRSTSSLVTTLEESHSSVGDKISDTKNSKLCDYFQKGLASDGLPDIVPREIFLDLNVNRSILPESSNPLMATTTTAEIDSDDGPPFRGFIVQPIDQQNLSLTEDKVTSSHIHDLDAPEVPPEAKTDAGTVSNLLTLNDPTNLELPSKLPTPNITENLVSDTDDLETTFLGFPANNDLAIDPRSINDLDNDKSNVPKATNHENEITKITSESLSSQKNISSVTMNDLPTEIDSIVNEITENQKISSPLVVENFSSNLRANERNDDSTNSKDVEKCVNTSGEGATETGGLTSETRDIVVDAAAAEVTLARKNVNNELETSKHVSSDVNIDTNGSPIMKQLHDNDNIKSCAHETTKNTKIHCKMEKTTLSINDKMEITFGTRGKPQEIPKIVINDDAVAKECSSSTKKVTKIVHDIVSSSDNNEDRTEITENPRETSKTPENVTKPKKHDSHNSRSKSRDRHRVKSSKKSSHHHRDHRHGDKKKKILTEKMVDEAVTSEIVKLVQKPNSKDTVMARMIEIDVEIHKLMNEKMTLYKMLENDEFTIRDDHDVTTTTKNNFETNEKIANSTPENSEVATAKVLASRLVRDLEQTNRGTKDNEVSKKSEVKRHETEDEIKKKKSEKNQHRDGKNLVKDLENVEGRRQRSNSESKNHGRRTTSEESNRNESSSSISREKTVSPTEIDNTETKTKKTKSKTLQVRSSSKSSPKGNHDRSSKDDDREESRERSAKLDSENSIEETTKRRSTKKTKILKEKKMPTKLETMKKCKRDTKTMEKNSGSDKKTIVGNEERGSMDLDGDSWDSVDREAEDDQRDSKKDVGRIKGLALLEASFKREIAQTKKLKVQPDSRKSKKQESTKADSKLDEKSRESVNDRPDKVSKHVMDAVAGDRVDQLHHEDTNFTSEGSIDGESPIVENRQVDDESSLNNVAKMADEVRETTESRESDHEESSIVRNSEKPLPVDVEDNKKSDDGNNANNDEPEEEIVDPNDDNHSKMAEVENLIDNIVNDKHEDDKSARKEKSTISEKSKLSKNRKKRIEEDDETDSDDNGENKNTKTKNSNDNIVNDKHEDDKSSKKEKSTISHKSKLSKNRKNRIEEEDDESDSRVSSPDIPLAMYITNNDENSNDNDEKSVNRFDNEKTLPNTMENREDENFANETSRTKIRHEITKKNRHKSIRDSTLKKKKSHDIGNQDFSKNDEESDDPLEKSSSRPRSGTKRKSEKSSTPTRKRSRHDVGKKSKKRKREKSETRETSSYEKEIPTTKKKCNSTMSDSSIVQSSTDDDHARRRGHKRKVRPELSRYEMENCKVWLIDCKYTYLSPNMQPKILKKLGISKINRYTPKTVTPVTYATLETDETPLSSILTDLEASTKNVEASESTKDSLASFPNETIELPIEAPSSPIRPLSSTPPEHPPSSPEPTTTLNNPSSPTPEPSSLPETQINNRVNLEEVDEDDDDVFDETIRIVKVADENSRPASQSEDDDDDDDQEVVEKVIEIVEDVDAELENVDGHPEESVNAAEEVNSLVEEVDDGVEELEDVEEVDDVVEEAEDVADVVEESATVPTDTVNVDDDPDDADRPEVATNDGKHDTGSKEDNGEPDDDEALDDREPTVIEVAPDSEPDNDEAVEPRRTRYTVHKGPILDIKVLDDSFLAASEDGCIYRYSQKSNGILNIYKGHEAAVTCIHVVDHRENSWKLYSGSLDGTFRCYEITTGLQERPAANVGSPVQCMDEAWGVIFVGTKSGHISRYNIKAGGIRGDRLEFSEKSVLALKASSEGPRKILIVASRNQPITIRDANSGLFLRTICGYKNHTVYSLMRERNLVYCGTSSTSIPVFDFTNGEQIAQYNAGVGIVCMRLYRQILFAGCYDGNIYVFDTKETKLICSIPGPGNMLLSMEIVDDEIIAGSKNRQLHSWRMPRQVRVLLSERT